METRIITEVKVYVLCLNNMQNNAESSTPIVGSFERDKVVSYYNNEKVPTYQDDGINQFSQGATKWHRVFRKDGPLMWFNAVYGDISGPPDEHFGHGIQEHWIIQGTPVNIPMI